jgi:ubiquinone biosynthesis protein Coq4
MPQNRQEAWLQRRFSAQSLTLVSLVLIDGGSDGEYIDYRLRSNHDLSHLILGVPDSVAK